MTFQAWKAKKQNSMTFQAWKAKKQNSMTSRGFQDLILFRGSGHEFSL